MSGSSPEIFEDLHERVRTAMANLQAAASAPPAHGAGLLKASLKKLYVQVLIAIVVVVALGRLYPSLAVEMKPLSDGFIRLIRAVVPVIVFTTVVVGIAKIGHL